MTQRAIRNPIMTDPTCDSSPQGAECGARYGSRRQYTCKRQPGHWGKHSQFRSARSIGIAMRRERRSK